MHPNMLIYEPHGMARLREETGERIGANVDPSHLYWQGITITDAIRYLGERQAIHHVHAKDTRIYDAKAREKGVLDTTPYTDEPNRSWLFRSVGYGHGESHWKDIVSTLRMIGYDGALSIEHEDSLTSSRRASRRRSTCSSGRSSKRNPGRHTGPNDPNRGYSSIGLLAESSVERSRTSTLLPSRTTGS